MAEWFHRLRRLPSRARAFSPCSALAPFRDASPKEILQVSNITMLNN